MTAATAKKEAQRQVISVLDVKPGMTVRIHERLKELNAKGEEKERVQVFEGLVLGRRGGNTTGATMTVRKISDGVAVEKIFPLHLPAIAKVEVTKIAQVRRAKLSYVRASHKKLKEKVVRG